MIRPVLEAVQGGAGCCGGITLQRRLQSQIIAQAIVVVQVFIALAQTEHPLAQQLFRLVFYQQRAARVGEYPGGRVQQPQAPIHLSEQQQPAVRTDCATPGNSLRLHGVRDAPIQSDLRYTSTLA